MESRNSCVRGVHLVVPPLHGFVDEKQMVGLAAVVLVEHFVVLENAATTLDLGVFRASFVLLRMNGSERIVP